MPTAYYIVPAIIILAIIGAAVYGRFAAKTRRGAIRSVAATMGFSYVAEDPAVLDRFAALGAPFDLGFDRRATNVLVGSWDGRPAIAWDYSYKTRSSGKNNSTVPTTWGLSVFARRWSCSGHAASDGGSGMAPLPGDRQAGQHRRAPGERGLQPGIYGDLSQRPCSLTRRKGSRCAGSRLCT